MTSSLVAKYYGKEDKDTANRTFDHVLKLTIILSIVVSVFAVAFAHPIMVVFSGQKDTLADSILYFRIVMGGGIFNAVFMLINAALRGFGKTKITFVTDVISSLVNILFNYLLIGGNLGFPALGIAGAAIATVMSYAAATIVCVCLGCRKDLFINIPYCFSAPRAYNLI